jgi:large subunit ribosomal protein L28
MSRRCIITNKKAQNGHKVSHSNIKTNHKREVNLQKKRFFDPETGRWIKLRLSAKAIKTITVKGFAATLKKKKISL